VDRKNKASKTNAIKRYALHKNPAVTKAPVAKNNIKCKLAS
jgi:hypothetical protein